MITALYGTLMIETARVRIENWYTHNAACMRSAGISNWVLTNHSPIVSANRMTDSAIR